MPLPNSNKRVIDTIDLTGDDDVRPTVSKAARIGNSSFKAPARTHPNQSNGRAVVSPLRSQASQYRVDEDGGNELIDELDASQNYGDPSYSSYELYGESNLSWRI
jgi:hypothetical protein